MDSAFGPMAACEEAEPSGSKYNHEAKFFKIFEIAWSNIKTRA
jgi:hypothetical protein